MILEYRSRKEFQHKDKTVQVCDDVCYQMFRLQQAMKAGDKDEILLFFEQYFTDEEEKENINKMKVIEEEKQHKFKNRGVHNKVLNSKREELKLDDLMTFSTQRQVIGVVVSNWVWDIENTKFLSNNRVKAKQQFQISPDNRQIYIKEDEYIFRNIFGNVSFNEGIHYWEIVADARTEHELKIGVSKINNMEDCPEYQQQMKKLEEKHTQELQFSIEMSEGNQTMRDQMLSQ